MSDNMNAMPTPETDAAVAEMKAALLSGCSKADFGVEVIKLQRLCRKLERERDVARLAVAGRDVISLRLLDSLRGNECYALRLGHTRGRWLAELEFGRGGRTMRGAGATSAGDAVRSLERAMWPREGR